MMYDPYFSAGFGFNPYMGQQGMGLGGFGGGFNPYMMGGMGGFNPMMGGYGGMGGFNPMMGGFNPYMNMGGMGGGYGGFDPMMGGYGGMGGLNPYMNMGGYGGMGGGLDSYIKQIQTAHAPIRQIPNDISVSPHNLGGAGQQAQLAVMPYDSYDALSSPPSMAAGPIQNQLPTEENMLRRQAQQQLQMQAGMNQYQPQPGQMGTFQSPTNPFTQSPQAQATRARSNRSTRMGLGQRMGFGQQLIGSMSSPFNTMTGGQTVNQGASQSAPAQTQGLF